MTHAAGCRLPSLAAVMAVAAALHGVGCAHTPVERLRVVTAPQGVVTRLADLTLQPGTLCVITLQSGATVRGRLLSLTGTELTLEGTDQNASPTASRKVFADADIARVARVTGMSKPARICMGAAVGAALSLPFAVSMFADMVVPGALMGSLVARGTGDSRLEVVLQRP